MLLHLKGNSNFWVWFLYLVFKIDFLIWCYLKDLWILYGGKRIRRCAVTSCHNFISTFTLCGTAGKDIY